MRLPDPARYWPHCWIAVTAALTLHVADEALTGFLPLYNAIVESARERVPWLPFPTFSFQVWLGGLILLVLLLLALTPVLQRRPAWRRLPSLGLGGLMLLNGLGHMAASLWLGSPAPGVYSSPVLLLTSVALLAAVRRRGR